MKNIFLATIRGYQYIFSPDHGILYSGTFQRCRFYPSCSQYAYESIEKNGIFTLPRILLRILRCNPFSQGGIDLS